MIAVYEGSSSISRMKFVLAQNMEASAANQETIKQNDPQLLPSGQVPVAYI
jgi:hypothetical protein